MSSRRTGHDLWFDIFIYVLFAGFLFAVVYPIYWILIASFSGPNSIVSGEITWFPKDFDLIGYRTILGYEDIWVGYRNSILYVVLGTSINIVLTLTSGYALSRKDLAGNQIFMFFIVFTMFFGGGLIPTYLVVQQLGIDNTIWAMVIPNAVGAFNVIIARTFFQSNIPLELLESAMMDGSSNFRFFQSIAVPLSMPLIAVIVIFTAVGIWNSYFSALIYLRDETLYPLQLILRNILVLQTIDTQTIDPGGIKSIEEKRKLAEQIKYGVIIVSSLPMLILYPFLQKYFVKGVMIGAIKG